MATNTSLWKPMPTLPGPEETQSWIRQRIAESDHSNHPANHTLSRTIEGKHGWKAILFGQISSHQTGLPYILSDLFLPLCDWWEEMAYEAVLNCPPPENVRYPATTKDGRSRMINTIKAWYEPWDIFIFDDKDCGNLHLPMDFTFEEQAPVSDIIWPFNPRALIDPMVSSVQDALGSQQFTGYAGRRRTDQLWKANHVLGRRNWKKVRIFEDWSGQTPEQRDIFTKPTPPPRKASGQWSKAPDYMATRICSGSEQCAYTPRADTQPAGSRRVVSGCERQWQAYCASLFQAFMESNPEVQFGPRLSCLRKIRQPKHNCYRNSDQCLKSPHLLDHGQAGRFPDGQKFCISHPYCETDVNIAAHHDAQNWLEKEPDLTWINDDTTRSWYFPTHSTLLITGYKQTLDRINLDYPLPNADAPTGCARWQPT